MIDYYKELGIPAYSDEMAIRASLASHNSGNKEAIEFILLNSSRKNTYDNTHRQLTKIGKLRDNAGLISTWDKQKYRAFIPSKTIFEHTVGWILGFIKGVWEVIFAVVLSLAIRLLPIALILGLIWGFFAWNEYSTRDERESATKARKLAEEQKLADYESIHPRLALPYTGILRKSYSQGYAPLEIRTRSAESNYYIKLISIDSGYTIMTAFIRSGQTLSITVPLGTYDIRYATGKLWYGETELFGEKTSRNRADDTFVFERTHSGYRGHTIELFLQAQGNLRTERMNEQSF
jgi:hypothetical protein